MADTQRIVLPAATTSLAAVAPTANLRLIAVSVIETAGSTAGVSVQEGAGTDLTKEVLAVSLSANEAKVLPVGEHGVPCPTGIWINRLSGTTRVVVHYRVSDYGKDSGEAPGW
jgi:hypothetical protein